MSHIIHCALEEKLQALQQFRDGAPRIAVLIGPINSDKSACIEQVWPNGAGLIHVERRTPRWIWESNRWDSEQMTYSKIIFELRHEHTDSEDMLRYALRCIEDAYPNQELIRFDRVDSHLNTLQVQVSHEENGLSLWSFRAPGMEEEHLIPMPTSVRIVELHDLNPIPPRRNNQGPPPVPRLPLHNRQPTQSDQPN